jgi:hypothetical protein
VSDHVESPAHQGSAHRGYRAELVGLRDDTVQRLGKATGLDVPEALALVSESVWWVTMVDATMIRYHEAAYDRVLSGLGQAGLPRRPG